MVRVVLVLVAVVGGACVDDPGFRCTTSAQCGPGGQCEAIGYCSFPDSLCASGRRFGSHDGTASGYCSDVDFGTNDASIPTDCGNGKVDVGEECDDGAGNDDNPSSSATCTTGCRRRVSCGDLTDSTGARIDPATGHCYVAFASVVNWQTAQRACQGRGGALVSISSSTENDIVRTLATTESWIGLTTPPATPHKFAWSSGDPLGFVGWAPGQPDNAGNVEECVSSNPDGWHDVPCGWPTAGLLPPSPVKTLPYVCEHTCGNRIVEHGEECDPPGPTCTNTCQNIRSCDDPAHISPITGHCYFLLNQTPNQTFDQAKTVCRPFGAHLATLNEPAETEAAFTALAIVPDAGVQPVFAWIALRANTATSGAINGFWDYNSEVFASRRYHAYTDPDPSQAPPSCSLISLHYTMFGTPDGWRDRFCTEQHLVLCERE